MLCVMYFESMYNIIPIIGTPVIPIFKYPVRFEK